MKTQVVAMTLVGLMSAVPAFAQSEKPASKQVAPAAKARVVHVDSKADFTKFKTYSYEPGQPAILKEANERIVADIEKELAVLGLEKAPSGPGDVTITYYCVTRTDVNLATFDTAEPAPGAQRKPAETYKVGTLVVDLKPSDKAVPAWRGKVEGVLSGDTRAQLAKIDQAVVALFALYPTHVPPKK